MGVEPKTIIAKGYSKATVYKYSRELTDAKRRVQKMLEN